VPLPQTLATEEESSLARFNRLLLGLLGITEPPMNADKTKVFSYRRLPAFILRNGS
jgi:hypothetical protein